MDGVRNSLKLCVDSYLVCHANRSWSCHRFAMNISDFPMLVPLALRCRASQSLPGFERVLPMHHKLVSSYLANTACASKVEMCILNVASIVDRATLLFLQLGQKGRGSWADSFSALALGSSTSSLAERVAILICSLRVWLAEFTVRCSLILKIKHKGLLSFLKKLSWSLSLWIRRNYRPLTVMA